MSKLGLFMSILFIGIVKINPAAAGYYSTIDTDLETRWSPDFRNVFNETLDNLRSIPVANPKRPPPMYRRYVLIETLGRNRALKLDTLEQKLNYTTVLIRRNQADKAVDILLELKEEHPENFVVLSQCATALFLARPEIAQIRELRPKAPSYLEEALNKWPTRWDALKPDQKAFLASIGWEETALERFRRYETYFQRLMENRLRDEARLKRKKQLPEAVDSIFTEPNEKPVRFVNDKGEFEPGRILPEEKKKLPRDAVEAVEQLLIWMPNDQRLLWLLGEVINARAMEHQKEDARIESIANAYAIFQKLDKQGAANRVKDEKYYGEDQIKSRLKTLDDYEPIHRPERIIDPTTKEIAGNDDDGNMMGRKWWRTLAVGFITGFAVGLFALWQLQEMRRRRQTRAAARS